MLYITIVTLLIASIGISRIQAKAIGEGRAQLNQTQTPVDGVNSVIEALTVQKNNTFNTGPNGENIYGSIVKVENNKYESPNSRQPTSTQTHTLTTPGGPGNDGVSYVKSEEGDRQGQPNQNQIPGKRTGIILGSETYQIGNTFNVDPGSGNVFGAYTDQRNQVFRFVGGKNQTQPNGADIYFGSSTIQINNTFRTNEGAKNSFGSQLYQKDNVYPDTTAQTGEEKQQNIESQAQLPNSSNRQLSLSFGKFYFYLYAWIISSNYYLL